MSPPDQFDYSEERGFWARYGFVIGIVGVAAVVAVLGSQMFSHAKDGPRSRSADVVMIRPINLPPPPPPPPPPPEPEQPKDQMVEQTPLNQEDIKPEEQPTPDQAAVGTDLKGDGPADAFGLRGGSGNFLQGSGGGGRGGASRFGWYARGVVQAVENALRENAATRAASFDLKVRVWADLTGRITRVHLAQSTGDAALDQAIEKQILPGLQLAQPPPDDMPMPIVMRLTARRPG